MGEKEFNEKKLDYSMMLRIASMICSTLMGIIALIGIFWGDRGLLKVGLVVLFLIVLIVFYGGSMRL